MIDKNIPLSRIHPKSFDLPLEEMVPGDSYFVSDATCAAIHRRIEYYRLTIDKNAKFKTRFWEQDGIKGRRVWRIEDR